MKRILVVAVTIGLLAGSLAMPAEAKKKKKKPAEPVKVERTVEATYQCPCGVDGVLGFVTAGGEFGGANVPVGAGEVWVKAEVTDSSGQQVAAAISQDFDGDGMSDASTDFCGSNEAAIPIEAGLEVTVFVYTAGNPGCPGPAAGGSMTLTFSNLP